MRHEAVIVPGCESRRSDQLTVRCLLGKMPVSEPVNAKLWAKRTLVVASAASLVLILLLAFERLASVLLLFFAGMVLAAFLRGVATWLARYTHVPDSVALIITLLVLLGLTAGVGVLLVPHAMEQIPELAKQIASLRDTAMQMLQRYPWLRDLIEQLRVSGAGGQRVVSRLFGIFSSTIGVLGSLAVIVFVGLYLAFTPGIYVRGALRLVPPGVRDRAQAIADEAGGTLQHWVLGRLLSCVIVGLGTALGVWLAGTPLALSLGVIAGVLSFVPNIGPILSVLPAIAVSLPQGLTQVAIVCGIYAGVQALESFVITPQIQQRTVLVPPVLLLLAQAVMGILTGVLGVLLATPLLACLMLIIKRTYVEAIEQRSGG